MDRLLTDEELAKAAYPALDGVPSHWLSGRNRRVADAASAKSIKVDRQAAAEWLEQNYGLVSMAWLVENLRTNKVPWEGEQDAVHTTRKTPRTIPPD